MRLYAVAFHGTGLVMSIDGKLEHCGFYKHEYVWAPSEDDAKESGLNRVSKKLALEAGTDDVGTLCIVAESVHIEPRIWKSLSSPGFVFYKDEAKLASAETTPRP